MGRVYGNYWIKVIIKLLQFNKSYVILYITTHKGDAICLM